MIHFAEVELAEVRRCFSHSGCRLLELTDAQTGERLLAHVDIRTVEQLADECAESVGGHFVSEGAEGPVPGFFSIAKAQA